MARDRIRARILAAALLASMAPVAAFAHHGWSGYQDAEFTLSGTIRSATLGNPHGLLKLEAEDGRVWDAVLGPPYRLQRANVTADVVPIGAKVVAHGHRHREDGRLEMKTERLEVNGKTFDMYPDRS